MAMTRTSVGIVILAAGLVGTPALAQEQTEKPETERPLLSGPEVQESRAPGTNRPMMDAPSDRPDGRVAQRYLTHRALVEALRALNSEAPEEIRPTAGQQREIRELLTQFAREMQRFRREFRADGDRGRARGEGAMTDGEEDGRPEVFRNRRSVRGEARETDRPSGRRRSAEGDPGDRRAGRDAEDRRATIDRMRREAPDPAKIDNRVWEVLTEPQRAWVEDRIEEIEAERQARTGTSPDADPMRIGDGSRMVRGSGLVAEMPESLRRRLEAMGPEGRAELWRRLEGFLTTRDRERDGPREPRRRLDVDDVDVPDPG